MLAACASSPGTRPADPVVEVRTVTRLVCPDEVTQPAPARVPTPADAAIEAAQEVLAWIARRFAREDALERRLMDAKAQCQAG